MKNEKRICKLPRCGKSFTPTHLNEEFCYAHTENIAKKQRQKHQRDFYKDFIPILVCNNQACEDLLTAGKTELSNAEIEAYQIDISLYRHMKPAPEHAGKLMLDFGMYFLITDKTFLHFEIFKHDTTAPI